MREHLKQLSLCKLQELPAAVSVIDKRNIASFIVCVASRACCRSLERYLTRAPQLEETKLVEHAAVETGQDFL